MTGRAAGFCAGYAMPGYANPMYWGGRGFGRGRGFRGGGWGGGWGGGGGGRGWRNRFYATGVPGWAWGGWWPASAPAPELEQEWLAQHAQALEGELKDVRTRLTELEKKGKEKT